ncbi:hypothetical protein HDU84_000251, partial [Entophlyctis sp. JEL0112]
MAPSTDSAAAALPSFGSEFYGKPGYPAAPNQNYPPLEDYEYIDVALKSDKAKESLFSIEGAVFKDLEPVLGTEISGVQLNQ